MKVLQNWIACEGLNGSGKSTYIANLPKCEKLLKYRDTYPVSFKPNLLVDESDNRAAFNTQKRLLGLDKYLLKNLNLGFDIISDRCFLSSLVYDQKENIIEPLDMHREMQRVSFRFAPQTIIYLEVQYSTFCDRLYKQRKLDNIERKMLDNKDEYEFYISKYRKWLDFFSKAIPKLEIIFKRL